MKIDRLLNIIVYLLNHGRTSAHKLAEEFEVSPRTIMRDLESIELAGMSMKTEILSFVFLYLNMRILGMELSCL